MALGWKDHQELLETIGYQRQAEVEAWLRESDQSWRSWIAIDDKAYLFRPVFAELSEDKFNHWI